jgi:hypothetical protein
MLRTTAPNTGSVGWFWTGQVDLALKVVPFRPLSGWEDELLLTYLLDTGCLIAAQTPREPHHLAAEGLVRAGMAGDVSLITAMSIEYDLEAASPELAQVRRAWLASRPFIRSVPGPFTLDVSRLDWGDVLVSDEQAESLGKLKKILAPIIHAAT